MPIYEWVCEDCGRLTERMQRVNDPAPSACPECGGAKLARLVSRTSFQLRGGGWYSDLYASAKRKPEAKDAATGDAPKTSSTASAGEAPKASAPATVGAAGGGPGPAKAG